MNYLNKFMAGVAGLEPTTVGFEDRSSTIELHPLNNYFLLFNVSSMALTS